MIDFYRKIAPELETTVVFNGDTDPCVSYEGTRTAIERVGFPELVGASYRPWFFNATSASVHLLETKATLFGPSLVVNEEGAQLGGLVVDYEKNLSFMTVHGSGHMVPQFRPRASFHMLKTVIAGKEFSPRFVSDKDLAAMDDKEFEKYMNQWTTAAKSSTYIDHEQSTPPAH